MARPSDIAYVNQFLNIIFVEIWSEAYKNLK